MYHQAQNHLNASTAMRGNAGMLQELAPSMPNAAVSGANAAGNLQQVLVPQQAAVNSQQNLTSALHQRPAEQMGEMRVAQQQENDQDRMNAFLNQQLAYSGLLNANNAPTIFMMGGGQRAAQQDLQMANAEQAMLQMKPV